MAGPCSAESEEQVEASAAAVKRAGAKVLRGGAFKPRSSPYSFQGLGEEGLRLLRAAADRHNLKLITEVMDISQIELIEKYAHILQVGARNMQNFTLLRELGKSRTPVMLKRGISATIEEWLLSAEYVLAGGNPNVMLCERGIRTFETAMRIIAPQKTKPKSIRAAVAVSRGPRRNAAHSNGRIARTPNGPRFDISAISGLKATAPKMPVAAKIALDSNSGQTSNDRGRSVVQRTRTGVIMSTAARSPSHHGNHRTAKFPQSMLSARLEIPTPLMTLAPTSAPMLAPTVAPMAAANMAIHANLAMSIGAAKALRPAAKLLTKKPPAKASSALPAAVATAT